MTTLYVSTTEQLPSFFFTPFFIFSQAKHMKTLTQSQQETRAWGGRMVGLLLLAGLLLALAAGTARAQVGIGTATPDAKAALDIRATDRGLLIPRLTAAQRSGPPTRSHRTPLPLRRTRSRRSATRARRVG